MMIIKYYDDGMYLPDIYLFVSHVVYVAWTTRFSHRSLMNCPVVLYRNFFSVLLFPAYIAIVSLCPSINGIDRDISGIRACNACSMSLLMRLCLLHSSNAC